MSTTMLCTQRDRSGKIEVSLFENTAEPARNHQRDLPIEVSPGMVVVGGGGEAMWSGYGALLFASYPDEELSRWYVSSKDHHSADPHRLKGWAIGMKIKGMTRAQLRTQMRVFSETSSRAAHPSDSVSVGEGYLLLSGGFRIAWRGHGNMAHASYPENVRTWRAKGKDHLLSDPAEMEVYAVGIRQHLPVGTLESTAVDDVDGPQQHSSATANLTSGYVLVGGGGIAHWTGVGRLLWRLRPELCGSVQQFTASSKDHGQPELGLTTAYAIGLRLPR